MAWVSIFDDNYWEAAPGPPWRPFGDNNWWETVSYTSGNLQVKTGETWNVGFNPTALRLTFSGALGGTITVNVLDSTLTQSWTGGVVGPVSSGQIIPLINPGADLEEMQFTMAGPPALIITNIEFDDPSITTSSTTTSTSTTTSSTASTSSSTTSSTSSSSSSSSTTTSLPPIYGRDDSDEYYYRHVQNTLNRLPAWMRARLERYSNAQQLLQPLGKELELLEESMRRTFGSLFLRTTDMEYLDNIWQIDIPYSFEFAYDLTDPINPRPKPPYVVGEKDSYEYEIAAVTENDIQNFWFLPLPDRISVGEGEIDLDLADLARIDYDVLAPTLINVGGVLDATYNEPFIPGRLYITIADGSSFGYKDNLINMPGYIEIHGITVKDTEETERLAFAYNATRLTTKFWQEITEIKIYNIAPGTATIALASAGATQQQLPDINYREYDTQGGRQSFWEIDAQDVTGTEYAALQHILPVQETVLDEPKYSIAQAVHRTWLLRDGRGLFIHYSQIADYTIERFRPYIYVLLKDGRILIYSKLAEYPDLASMRLLKQRTDGAKTVISVDYDEGILADRVRIAPRVATKTKRVAWYYLEGARPTDDGELVYIGTDSSWGSTRADARVTLENPTADLPYKDYVIDLDEYGVYTFVLTTRYLDGTTDVDVKMVFSRAKVPLVWFDTYDMDPDLSTPLAICFDYNQRLWLGGLYDGDTDFKFREILTHADLMLVDYAKKLLYLREQYDEVKIYEDVPDLSGGLWLEFFDNTFWADDTSYPGGHFTWSGTQWEQLSEPRSGRLVPIGGWEVGYRPSHIRIVYSGPTSVRFDLRDVNGDSLATRVAYTSGDPIEINWGVDDLASLEFQWAYSTLIIPPMTIEFFEVGATTTSSTTTTTSTTTSTFSTTSSTSTTTSSSSSTSTTASTVSTSSSSSSTSTTASSSSSTSSTTTTTALPYVWMDFTDNTYWEDDGVGPGTFIWNSKTSVWWIAGDPSGVGLTPIGGWAITLRPVAVRITYTGSLPGEVYVYDTTPAVVGSDTMYYSLDEIDTSALSTDLFRLRFILFDSPLEISKIELLVPPDYVEPSWEGILGPSYWEDAGESVPFSWDVYNNRYEVLGGGAPAGLQPTGSWSTGIRPIALRLNYGPSHEITVKDTNGDTIGYSALYTSGEPILLTFGSYDIGEIYFNGVGVDSSLLVTNIEMLIAGWNTTTVNINHGSFGGSMSSYDGTWSGARDATDADTIGPTWGVPYGYLADVYLSKGIYYLKRAIAEFNLSSIPDGATILEAQLVMNYGGPAFYGSTYFVAQEADAGGKFDAPDWDAFTGPELGRTRIISADWTQTMYLNADGTAAIEANLVDNTLQIMFREYNYDFSDLPPTTGRAAAHYAFDDPITLRIVYKV